MANDFKVGDFVNWKYGDGKPDHIVSFGWQHHTVFLSRQPKTGVPVTELTVASSPVEAFTQSQASSPPFHPSLAGKLIATDVAPEPVRGEATAKPAWTPDPPKGH